MNLELNAEGSHGGEGSQMPKGGLKAATGGKGEPKGTPKGTPYSTPVSNQRTLGGS